LGGVVDGVGEVLREPLFRLFGGVIEGDGYLFAHVKLSPAMLPEKVWAWLWTAWACSAKALAWARSRRGGG
jgi:hypothetical protein